ncbi:MAG: hypothetical protein C5B47_00680 [Verrucomicrobia bacterium]|nr:MAG: hypothetical protein C5B47_00680 [Verrucomicrobiota bacterium]
MHELRTPCLLIDLEKMDQNLRSMQSVANESKVELWPHLKTHKMRKVWQQQQALGAQGATCSKISEVEALLPIGLKRLILAYPLAMMDFPTRIARIYHAVDELILTATSLEQFRALEKGLAEARLPEIPILLAIDSGLGREGVRTPEASAELGEAIQKSPHTRLLGVFTHEGHAYSARGIQEVEKVALETHQRFKRLAEPIGCADSLWPGCSITARFMASLPGVRALRPGTYVFGDLNLSVTAGVMPYSDIALTVLTTVTDRPAADMVIVDAGSKTLSSDKTLDGVFAMSWPHPSCEIRRVSEEHGWLTGPEVSKLRVGDRIRLVTAHVCPTVNLAREVHCLRGEKITESWPVDAASCSQ